MLSSTQNLNDKNLSGRWYVWLKLSPFFLALIITLVIVFGLKFLPTRLPLFYSLAWGDSELANHQQFLLLPVSLTAIALFNLIIAWQLHPSQSFFKKVLLFSSTVIGLILIISFVKIILNFI